MLGLTYDDRNPPRRSLTTLLLLDPPRVHRPVNWDAVSIRVHARRGHTSRRDGMNVRMTVPMKWRLWHMVLLCLQTWTPTPRVERGRAKEA